jgi:hypothetical protein
MSKSAATKAGLGFAHNGEQSAMQRRLIEGSITVGVLLFSLFVVNATSHNYFWYDPIWWAISVALTAWMCTKLRLTAPFVKTAVLVLITVLVMACFHWRLLGGRDILLREFWNPYFYCSPMFFVAALWLIFILSNAFGLRLPSEVRPGTCLAAGMMSTWIHPVGLDYPIYYDHSSWLLFLVAIPYGQ